MVLQQSEARARELLLGSSCSHSKCTQLTFILLGIFHLQSSRFWPTSKSWTVTTKTFAHRNCEHKFLNKKLHSTDLKYETVFYFSQAYQTQLFFEILIIISSKMGFNVSDRWHKINHRTLFISLTNVHYRNIDCFYLFKNYVDEKIDSQTLWTIIFFKTSGFSWKFDCWKKQDSNGTQYTRLGFLKTAHRVLVE